uniref:Pecanex-like protein n=1 Tax=Schistocephalus solidus TaxID=70667 RepID=A0A183SBR6_SCHSO
LQPFGARKVACSARSSYKKRLSSPSLRVHYRQAGVTDSRDSKDFRPPVLQRLPSAESDPTRVTGSRSEACSTTAGDASTTIPKQPLISTQWHRSSQKTTDFVSLRTSLLTPPLSLLLPEFLTAICQPIS